jgi:cation diffusion facilitator CzcD-associated flavoprotein CzcO
MTHKVCIIGAGASGLAAAKTLHENTIEFDWFEMSSGIGGNWRYNNDNGRSAAYDSLHIDTSKDRMAFSDFPMPKVFPNYLYHSQVLEYFERYAEHFGLISLVNFRSRVDHVEPFSDGGYKVTTENLDSGIKEINIYTAVLVCNGHHWNPKMPNFPGEFDGEIIHSRHYRNPDNFKDKNVLILGVGNSGVDIACDVAPVAARTFLASRHSAHVIPRYLLGRPTDKWTTPFFSRFPFSVQQVLFSLIVWLSRGRQSSMPAPPTRILTEHPTLSTELLPLVRASKILPKPAVERLNGSEIIFTDGTRETIDVFICATGYRICFPFLNDQLISTAENRIGLYGKVVHPDHPGLYFIGLIQPLGAIMPLAELQAKWVAGLITGRLSLPTRDKMAQAIINDQTILSNRYVPSTRHTIQVDFFPYKRWLERQLVLLQLDILGYS